MQKLLRTQITLLILRVLFAPLLIPFYPAHPVAAVCARAAAIPAWGRRAAR